MVLSDLEKGVYQRTMVKPDQQKVTDTESEEYVVIYISNHTQWIGNVLYVLNKAQYANYNTVGVC